MVASSGLTAERRLSEGAVESWTGSSFYKLPDPIPVGSPGRLVRAEKLASAPKGALAWRILYHSTDVHGQNILVSGVVVAPNAAAPRAGRTIVSWGHPTTGAAQRCAPSVGIDPFDTIEGLRDLLAAGYVVVATDYSGMGAAGPASYLVGVTEGNNVLDAVRAARQLPETHANNHLVLWGHSQGGQAVLFAGQLAAAYAPELLLKGVAVAAPATDLGALMKSDIGDVSGVTIASYAFAAYASVYASMPGANLDSILTPRGVMETPKMAALCNLGQRTELHDLATPLIGRYLTGDPSKVEPWSTLLTENSPGAVQLTVPLFVAQGQTDALVRPEVTRQFADRETSLGTSVTFISIPNTGHGLVALRAMPKLMEWLKQI